MSRSLHRYFYRLPVIFSLFLLTACQTQLYSHLSERDAMAMTAILLKHGIAADRIVAKDGSSTVEVPSSHVAEAVSVLEANHYPRNDYESMDKIFQQEGMISTPTAERAKLYFGISQELDHTLNDIDGVIDARVHIAPAASDPVTGEDKPASAAVVIRYDIDAKMTGLLPKIKLMVANAVQDLAYDRVSVILLPVQSPVPQPLPTPTWIGPIGVLGWILAVASPAGYGAHYWWRNRRKKKKTPLEQTKLSVVPRQTA